MRGDLTERVAVAAERVVEVVGDDVEDVELLGLVLGENVAT